MITGRWAGLTVFTPVAFAWAFVGAAMVCVIVGRLSYRALLRSGRQDSAPAITLWTFFIVLLALMVLFLPR